MRVAIDVFLAEKHPGGMMFAIRALLEGLARTDHVNEYVVITGHPDEYRALGEAPNFQIHALRPVSWKGSLIQHQLLLPAVLRRVRPDLVHVTSFAAPICWRGPMVVTVHDLAFLTGPRNQSLYARLYWQYVLRHSVRRARRIVAVSEQTRDELAALWSVNPDRIAVIHNALRSTLGDVRPAPAGARQLRASLGSSYILHVGRIVARKNVEQLIHAFDLVAPTFADLHLVLVGGTGYGSAAALELIESSPYRERIHLMGWVSDEDLAVLYAEASVLVFPSHHEGFGLPMLEAMACGTPVVASLEAANPTIVGDDVIRVDCGSSAPLAQAIVEVLTNHELRAQLIERGLRRAQSFSPDACAIQTQQVYEAVLAAERPQREGVHAEVLTP